MMVNTNPAKIMNRILGNQTARKRPVRRRMRQTSRSLRQNSSVFLILLTDDDNNGYNITNNIIKTNGSHTTKHGTFNREDPIVGKIEFGSPWNALVWKNGKAYLVPIYNCNCTNTYDEDLPGGNLVAEENDYCIKEDLIPANYATSKDISNTKKLGTLYLA